MDLNINCPNANDLSEEQLKEFVTDNKFLVPKNIRMNVIKKLYMCLGLTLENEVLLSMADGSDKKLLLAVAGGGKTTQMVVDAQYQQFVRKSETEPGKVLNGEKILFLVYNESNVSDVKDRYSSLTYKLKSILSNGKNDNSLSKIVESLDVNTMHSFCRTWVNEYAERIGVVNFKLMDEDNKYSLMDTAITIMSGTGKYVLPSKYIDVSQVLSFYNYMRERMLSYEDMVTDYKFIDLNLPKEFIEDLFTSYDNIKRRRKFLDFTDYLTKFYELICGNFDKDKSEVDDLGRNDVVQRIQSLYEVFYFDEYQDSTMIMKKILEKLTIGRSLTCIGDDDQSIYGFRGADSENALMFKDTFPDARVFLLSTNRRCPSNVVRLSEYLISMNTKRFKKKMRYINPKGTIELRSYGSRIGQFLNIFQIVKKMNDEERSETCICFRNKTTSVVLTDMMIQNGVPYYVQSGNNPFEYKLFSSILEILEALYLGNNKKYFLNLYKVLPISKDRVQEILKYDKSLNVFTDGVNLIHISKLQFEYEFRTKGFTETFKDLCDISRSMKDEYLKQYFPRIFNYVLKYYWNGYMDYMGIDPNVDEYMRNTIISYFNINKTYAELKAELASLNKILDANQKAERGVCISTFHKLKGLEFDNVFMIDMKESIYPNYLRIEEKNYPKDVELSLKEEETRICYVAVTRAKKRLYVYYDKNEPSRYIEYIKMFLESEKETEKRLESMDLQAPTIISDDEEELLMTNNKKSSIDDILGNKTPRKRSKILTSLFFDND
jgi:DNA helicase-2/ATP-dependent DNA helicase PcrA